MTTRYSLLGSLTVLAISSAARGQCQYEVTVVPSPVCGPFGNTLMLQGLALSDSGEVVGSYSSCPELTPIAFRWSLETGLITIDVNDDEYAWTELVSINPDGVVAGNVNIASDAQRGFIMPDSETIIEFVTPAIGFPPPQTFSHASAINRWGDVTGFWGTNDANPFDRGFLWTKGTFVDLGDVMPFSLHARPSDVNDHGVVVGWRSEGSALQHEGFLFSDGDTTFLGPIPGGVTSDARAINNYGVVAGAGMQIGKQGEDLQRGVLWKDGVFLSTIEPLEGFDHLALSDINDHGVAIGAVFCYPGCGGTHAVVFVGGTLYQLEDLLIAPVPGGLGEPRSINSHGQILCSGLIEVILTPIDPPLTDLDGDCAVGFHDLVTLLTRWATSDDLADFNDDGAVGFHDLVTLLLNWG